MGQVASSELFNKNPRKNNNAPAPHPHEKTLIEKEFQELLWVSELVTIFKDEEDTLHLKSELEDWLSQLPVIQIPDFSFDFDSSGGNPNKYQNLLSECANWTPLLDSPILPKLAKSLAFQNSNLNEALRLYEIIYDRQVSVSVSTPDLGPDPDHLSTLATQCSIADCLRQLKDHGKALDLYNTVYDKRREILGGNHPDTIQAQFNFGIVLQEQGETRKALSVLKDVYNKQNSNPDFGFGKNHVDTGTFATQCRIAQCFFDLQEYGSSLVLYRSVYEKRCKNPDLGPSCKDTLLVQIKIGTILQIQEKYEAAFDEYESIFNQDKTAVRSKHVITLDTFFPMLFCLFKLKAYQRAVSTFEMYYGKHLATAGPRHPNTLKSQHCAGICFFKLKDYGRALDMFRIVREQRILDLGPHHEDTLQVQNDIAVVFQNQNKYKEAFELFQKIYQVRSSSLGPTHPSTLNALFGIADCLNELEEHGKALELYRFLYEKQNQNWGPHHKMTLKAQYDFAAVLAMQGHCAEAMELFQNVYEKQETFLGANHPDTVMTRDNMGIAKNISCSRVALIN